MSVHRHSAARVWEQIRTELLPGYDWVVTVKHEPTETVSCSPAPNNSGRGPLARAEARGVEAFTPIFESPRLKDVPVTAGFVLRLTSGLGPVGFRGASGRCEAFGFAERWTAGAHRAQLEVGDAAVVLMADDGGGRAIPQSPITHGVMVRVEDVDAHHKRAQLHGARKPTDFPYGERQYNVEDLAGHCWTFSQTTPTWPPRTGAASRDRAAEPTPRSTAGSTGAASRRPASKLLDGAQVPLADDRAAEVHEGLVQLRAALPAQAQATEEVQPGEGALDDPAQEAQPGAVL